MSERLDLAVVANPAAGRGRVGRFLPSVLDSLRASGLSVGVFGPGTSRRLLDTVPKARAVVAVGGTVHLAVQALAGRDVPLGVVPLGTGNDFADALGLAGDPGAAVRAIIADLDAGAAGTAVDAVLVRPDHWFVAILSVGFDSAVNARANRMRWPRGPRRYDLAILAELARLRTYPLRLELDDVLVETPALLAAVGNTRSYGGGMRMCPDADPFDGLLDVTVVEPVSRFELIRVKPRLYTGTHVEHPRVRTYRAKHVKVDAPGADAFVDGEPGRRLPLALDCVPGAFRVLGVNSRPGV